MISRLYVDQYKCLVDFEARLGPLQLLTGRNGSGKSTFLDVIESLRRVVAFGQLLSVEFPTSETLTAWSETSEQRVELEIQCGQSNFEYELVLEHDRRAFQCTVKSERLRENSLNVLSFENGLVRLFSSTGREVSRYQQLGIVSPLSTAQGLESDPAINAFRQHLANSVHIHHPDAPRIGSVRSDRITPNRSLDNLPEWLYYVYETRRADFQEVVDYLRHEVVIGLTDIEFNRYLPDRSQVLFRFEGSEAGNCLRDYRLPIGQLSDGQRMLVAIYSLAILNLQQGATLCIEEPDNYLALNEVQPWLMFLRDRAEAKGAQVFLTSHHPETFNYFAVENGLWFDRDEAGRATVEPFGEKHTALLAPAEVVARGWR